MVNSNLFGYGIKDIVYSVLQNIPGPNILRTGWILYMQRMMRIDECTKREMYDLLVDLGAPVEKMIAEGWTVQDLREEYRALLDLKAMVLSEGWEGLAGQTYETINRNVK